MIVFSMTALGVHAQEQSPSVNDRFVLIRTDLTQRGAQLIDIDRQNIRFVDSRENAHTSIDINQCIALLRPDATVQRPRVGTIRLADGQVLPGETLSNADPDSDAIVWNHAWLGRMEIPLSAVSSVTFAAGALPPQPGVGDVVLFTNGDRRTGLILQFGDPMVIEVQEQNTRSEITVPADLIAAVTLVSQPQPRTGTRVWFNDGTIVDVRRLLVGSDGLARLEATPAGGTTLQAQRSLSDIVAVFFRSDALVPLATLDPISVEGPPTRFSIPRPAILNANAVADLSSIEFRGPLTARYKMPGERCRFAAAAELPDEASTWGDCELIIHCDGREVFSAHLSTENSSAAINLTLEGRELSIELKRGSHGSIQDRVVLHRAMFLVQ